MNGTMATSGYYDSGDVCASESTAYVYIQSTCSNSTTVDITVSAAITALLLALATKHVLQPSLGLTSCLFLEIACKHVHCTL